MGEQWVNHLWANHDEHDEQAKESLRQQRLRKPIFFTGMVTVTAVGL